jgi:O-antigen/teichoic acid export membrane protein
MSDSSPVALAESIAPASLPSRDILTAAKGGGMIFFGNLFSYACRFVFGIIVARAIGAAGYGLYDLGVTASLILGGVAVLGLESGIVCCLPAAVSDRDEAQVWVYCR